MKAKAEAATGETKVGYKETVAKLTEQLNDIKIQSAKTWDVADDKWDAMSTELQATWAEWEVRAKSTWNDLK